MSPSSATVIVIVAVPYDKLGEVFHGIGDSVDGKVVVDARLSSYLNTYRSDSGILVARPLR